MDPVELLLAELTRDGRWPTAREKRTLEHVRTMRAFLESDRDRLRIIHGWSDDRDYKVDPLPDLIATAWADHLFGEDPVVTPANDADAGLLATLLEGNEELVGDLHNAERAVSGEGEQWWRVYTDEEVADVPLLEWHSRDDVFPIYVGHRLVATALITVLEDNRPRDRSVYRHLEIHLAGAVEHVLFRGTKMRLGETVPLENHPETADLADTLGASGGQGQRWEHGLPMLMGRVTNGRKRVKRLGRLGVSDFYGREDFLLDLNEAAAIGAENARLTAKRRLMVPEGALSENQAPAGKAYTGALIDRGDGSFVPANGRPLWDAGEDVLVVTELDKELGGGASMAPQVLEYSFDAAALIAYKRDLVETALTRTGLTPQYVGVITGQGDGLALSGTALRLRLIPTTKAGTGKARPWADALPAIIARMASLDALPVDSGGFGRAWTDATTPPAVERPNPLPQDEVEDATVEATLVGAGVRSRRTSVERQHPDWTSDQVDEELGRIADERPAPSSGLGGSPLG